MKAGIILVCLVVAAAVCGCGSASKADAANSNETSPLPMKPDATAADNAKAVANNPHMSSAVKKVVTGAGGG